jgi:crotonobetainyl-CoA hydratase
MNGIRIARHERVTRITLDRPEVLNALDGPMHHALQAAFDDFASDPDQHVCVLTGAGERAFCAGSDLKAAARAGAVEYPRSGYGGLVERFDCPKPIIAAVNGVALGGGFEMALACDIVIASESARFGLPEPRVGAVALGGGLHRIARQIGLKPAMGLVLRAEAIDAGEAFRLGLVNEVVPSGELDDAVARWCAAILKSAPLAIRASKEAMMRGLDEPGLGTALARQAAYPAFVAWRASEDLAEGPRAFVEKRPPVWRGR